VIATAVIVPRALLSTSLLSEQSGASACSGRARIARRHARQRMGWATPRPCRPQHGGCPEGRQPERGCSWRHL